MSEGRKRWFLVGVGGCGCNVMDDIVANVQRSGGPLKELYKSQIRGWTFFDTNLAHLKAISAIQSEAKQLKGDRSLDAVLDDIIVNRYLLGGTYLRHRDGVGNEFIEAARAVRADRETIDEVSSRPRLENLLENAIINRFGPLAEVIEAGAVMIFGGLGRGTGCGATPEIADWFGRGIGDESVAKPTVFVTYVLPSRQERDYGRQAANCLYGLSEVYTTKGKGIGANPIKGIFVVDNEALNRFVRKFGKNLVGIKTSGSRWRRNDVFPLKEMNPPIVKFFQLLINASPDVSRMKGEVIRAVDISEIVRWSTTSKHETESSLIVPCITPIFGEEYDPQVLVYNAVKSGMLAECDPSTADGCYVIIAASRDLLERIRSKGGDISVWNLNPDEIVDLVGLDAGKAKSGIMCGGMVLESKKKDVMGALVLLRNPSLDNLGALNQHRAEFKETQVNLLEDEYDEREPRLQAFLKAYCSDTDR